MGVWTLLRWPLEALTQRHGDPERVTAMQSPSERAWCRRVCPASPRHGRLPELPWERLPLCPFLTRPLSERVQTAGVPDASWGVWPPGAWQGRSSR